MYIFTTYICMYVPVCMKICVSVYACVCLHMCMYAYAYYTKKHAVISTHIL